MWNNVRKEVKKLVDDDALARAEANCAKGNKDARRKRVSTTMLIIMKLNLTFWSAVQRTPQVGDWLGQPCKV